MSANPPSSLPLRIDVVSQHLSFAEELRYALAGFVPALAEAAVHWADSQDFCNHLEGASPCSTPNLVFPDAEDDRIETILSYAQQRENTLAVLCARGVAQRYKALNEDTTLLSALRFHERYGVQMLISPIEVSAMAHLLERCRNIFASKLLHRYLEEALAGATRLLQAEADAYITLPTSQGEEVFRCASLVVFEAQGKHTLCTALNDAGDTRRVIVVFASLSLVERRLPVRYFQRVHDSSIVNLGFVREWNHHGKGAQLVVEGRSEKVSVSRTYKKDLVARLKNASGLSLAALGAKRHKRRKPNG